MKGVQLTEAQVESLIREVQHDATTTSLITVKAVIAKGGGAQDIVSTLERILDNLTVVRDEAMAKAGSGPPGMDITKGPEGSKGSKGLN